MLKLSVMLPIYKEEECAVRTIEEIREFAPQSHLVIGYTPHKIGVSGLYLETQLEVYLKALERSTLLYIYERGKGLAVQRMLQACPPSESVVMLDSDFTYPAINILTILEKLVLEDSDVVLAWRKRKEQYSMTLANKVGNWSLSVLGSLLYGQRVHDVCTGMWGFKGSIIPYLSQTCTRKDFTIEAEMYSIIKKLRLCKVKEISINYRARLLGTQAKLRVSDGFRIGACLLKQRFNGT